MISDKKALSQLENELREAGYVLRYERGHFRAGFCLVHERKVVIVNKFFDEAARLNTLREISAELLSESPSEMDPELSARAKSSAFPS